MFLSAPACSGKRATSKWPRHLPTGTVSQVLVGAGLEQQTQDINTQVRSSAPPKTSLAKLLSATASCSQCTTSTWPNIGASFKALQDIVGEVHVGTGLSSQCTTSTWSHTGASLKASRRQPATANTRHLMTTDLHVSAATSRLGQHLDHFQTAFPGSTDKSCAAKLTVALEPAFRNLQVTVPSSFS